jgi:ketosteroid isomerase-like protein
MKKLVAAAVVVVAIILTYFVFIHAKSQKQIDAELYITKSETEWAESLANGDVSVVERIVADDFRGIETDGTVYNKAKAMAETRDGPKDFVSNHLGLVVVRYFGDTAIAQGEERWERKTGSPLKGRYVWTDTWLKRNGKWQIVAAEDVLVPEPSSVR